MKWIKKSVLGLLLVLVFGWVFLTSLVYQAPVSWLVYQAQQGWLAEQLPVETRQLLLQVNADAFEGHLGKGQANNLQLAGGEVARVEWQLSWWRLLFLNPALQVELGEEPLPWRLKASASPWGIYKLELEAGSLEVVQGLPLAFLGRLEGKVVAHLAVNQKRMECVHLQGDWQGVVRLQSPMSFDLGRVSLQPSCPSEQQLGWQLSSAIQNEHQLELQGQASVESWSFTAQAQVHEEAELAALLRMLGWRVQGPIQEGGLAPGQRLEARGGGRF